MPKALAEVFLVRVNPNSEKCELYGTIQVTDEKGTLIIYNRELENSESILENGTLSLTSPNRAISAHDNFRVDFDLKEKKGGVEFIKGSSHWDLSKTYDWYNKCVPKIVRGQLDSATLYVTVLNPAVQATIHAQLFKVGCGNQQIDVSGSLIARYDGNYYYHCDDKNHVDLKKNTCLVLFKATEDKPAKLSLEEFMVDIPLSRSLVAMPAYSSLKFEVKLKCVYPNDHHQEVIENYVVQFPANRFGGSDAVDIEGKYGFIRLIASWWNNYEDYCAALWKF